MTTHSDMFKRFAVSVEGVDEKWREALDKEAYDALDKNEQREAQELLMRYLEENDTRSPPFLADITCRGAVAPMKRALPNASGRMKVVIAQALEKLEAQPADPLLIEILRSGDPEGGLSAIAEVRVRKLTEDMIDTLAWTCLHHPEPGVRKSAGSILIYRSGVTEDPLAWDFRPTFLPLGSDKLSVRRDAFREICKIATFPVALADTL